MGRFLPAWVRERSRSPPALRKPRRWPTRLWLGLGPAPTTRFGCPSAPVPPVALGHRQFQKAIAPSIDRNRVYGIARTLARLCQGCQGLSDRRCGAAKHPGELPPAGSHGREVHNGGDLRFRHSRGPSDPFPANPGPVLPSSIRSLSESP